VSICTERGSSVAEAQVANRITSHITLDRAATRSPAARQAEPEQTTFETEQESSASYRSFCSEWVPLVMDDHDKIADSLQTSRIKCDKNCFLQTDPTARDAAHH
jgi:hypothetical protein